MQCRPYHLSQNGARFGKRAWAATVAERSRSTRLASRLAMSRVTALRAASGPGQECINIKQWFNFYTPKASH